MGRILAVIALRTAVLWAVLAAFFIGCAAPYRVVLQASPNPFLAANHAFVVEPMRYEQLRVEGIPEALYLAEKSPRQRDLWEADKVAMNAQFDRRLILSNPSLPIALAGSAGVDANAFIIRVTVTSITIGGMSKECFAQMTVQILSSSGRRIDSIVVTGEGNTYVNVGVLNLTAGTRLRRAASDAGDRVGSYLRARTTVPAAR